MTFHYTFECKLSVLKPVTTVSSHSPMVQLLRAKSKSAPRSKVSTLSLEQSLDCFRFAFVPAITLSWSFVQHDRLVVCCGDHRLLHLPVLFKA